MQYNLFQNRVGSLPLGNNYHPALDINFTVVSIEYIDHKEQIYGFRRCDYNYIRTRVNTPEKGKIRALCILYHKKFVLFKAFCVGNLNSWCSVRYFCSASRQTQCSNIVISLSFFFNY